MSTVFGTQKIRVVVFWSVGFVGLFANSFLKTFPVRQDPGGGGGLCVEPEPGTQSRLILSAPAPRRFLAGVRDWGRGCGPKKSATAIRTGSWRGRAAARQLWSRQGASPHPGPRAKVEAGAHAHCLQSARLGVPDRGPWGKRMETGAQAQLAPCNTHSCKTSCFHFLFSLLRRPSPVTV